MLGLFDRETPAAPVYEPAPPAWLADIDLLIVDFSCLVERFEVPEFALRRDLQDYCQRTYWQHFEFDPIGPDIRRLRDSVGWTAYRDAIQILERWELRAALRARPDRQAWRTLLDFHLDGGLVAVVGDHTQHAMHRTAELMQTDFALDMIVGTDDVDRPKPDPAMLVAVQRATRLPPDRLLFVGRGRGDLSAAQRAGLPYRDYRRSFGQPEDLESRALSSAAAPSPA